MKAIKISILFLIITTGICVYHLLTEYGLHFLSEQMLFAMHAFVQPSLLVIIVVRLVFIWLVISEQEPHSNP